MIRASATTHTIYFDNLGQYYPCSRGHLHRGQYALNDWMQCECDHDELLVMSENQGICMQCGKVSALVKEPHV